MIDLKLRIIYALESAIDLQMAEANRYIMLNEPEKYQACNEVAQSYRDIIKEVRNECKR